MKKIMAIILIFAVFNAGCTGSFNLTRKVYNFHRSQADKWSDELCFLVVALLPIYGFATLADAIVFNSIEFWTGKNPVDMSYVPPASRIVQNGNEKYRMSYNSKTDQVTLTSLAKGNNHGLIFERADNMITAKNEKGQVLYSSLQGKDGGVSIYDGKGKLVKNYPAGQIALLKERYMTNN
ncbi:MAG: DUF3332 family protein [Candidatus Omnitrophica bacterium]|nr:DUF3332 family protein [Candidatus Omnitrophota bacterium]